MRGLLLAWVLLAGCGGSDSGSADAAVDASGPIDAVVIDAADPCQLLCSCAESACSLDFDTCVADCAGLPASVQTCRIMHCGYAQQNPAFHCPHVEGDPDSPGIPPECIAP